MMNNPMAGNMRGLNQMQLLQQLRQNPIQVLRQAGLNVPDNLSDPNSIIQHLMNSGQITQQRYEQARQIAAQLKK